MGKGQIIDIQGNWSALQHTNRGFTEQILPGLTAIDSIPFTNHRTTLQG
jgi:hypothetical protein